MKLMSQERGQALILIVFAAVGLFAFAALAIDGSRVFSDRRHAQNAADTAVLAAALAKVRENPSWQQAGIDRASSNGFNETNSTVEIHLCDETPLDPPCEALPADAVLPEYIQVVIRLNTQTTFARIIGRNQVPSVVSAVARVQGSSSSGTSSSEAAMLATKGGLSDQCFTMTGDNNLSLYTHGSGIFVNCGGSQAMAMTGNPYLHMDSTGQVVGCTTPGFLSDPIQCGAAALLMDASTFASVPTTQPPPACGSPVVPSGSNYTPGSYSNILINGSATMAPGVYCVSGSFIVTGTLTAPGGKVQIVLQNQGITLTDGSVMDFTDMEIYGSDAGVTLVGASTLHSNRLRYYSTGAGEFTVVGPGELSSGDAYFYLYRGNIDWNGDATLELHAPLQGDPFGGLLIHKPWENNSDVLLNGGTNTHLTGTFMVPGSHVRLNGNSAFELHSQLIGYTFEVGGTSTVDIFYDPSENYSPPDSPMIQLTK